MQPGDLRRFKDSKRARDLGRSHAGRTFMVLRVRRPREAETWRWLVDILLDSKREEDLGYNWVMNNSEVISEAG